MLEIHSLSVAYGERRALKNVSFALNAGEILAVIGPNGAGKSTLIRALSGVVHPQGGKMLLNGQEINRMNPGERARHISVVPQAAHLPPAFTAWETVLLGRTPYLNWLGQISAKDEALAGKAMRRTDTLELADRLVGELSGGEQQRLMLARALTQSAPLLLMDEPTAHLDLQYQLNLLQLIRALVQEDRLAVLIAMHDLNLVARFADRVLLLVNGEQKALGEPPTVLTPEILSRAYRVPLEVLSGGQGGVPLVFPAG